MNTTQTTPAAQDARLPENEAAAYLGVKPTTLQIWRSTNRYPLPYIKVGRLVRYRLSDLDAFLTQRTRGA
jgi:excisionase family DNA binding protein